jgi:hypothetical protein
MRVCEEGLVLVSIVEVRLPLCAKVPGRRSEEGQVERKVCKRGRRSKDEGAGAKDESWKTQSMPRTQHTFETARASHLFFWIETLMSAKAASLSFSRAAPRGLPKGPPASVSRSSRPLTTERLAATSAASSEARAENSLQVVHSLYRLLRV